MMKHILIASAIIMTLGIVSESWAAWSDNCPSGTVAESTCNQCGFDCAYTQTSAGAVTLYGSGEVIGAQYYNGKVVMKGMYSTPHPFYENTSITSIVFSDNSNFTGIGDYAFRGMSGVTGSITIPDSVTSIKDWAFMGMSNLNTIVIPDSLADNNNSFTSYAFYEIPSSVQIVCQGSLTKCQQALQGKIASTSRIQNISDAYVDDEIKKSLCNSGMYVWDSTASTCKRKEETACNSMTKYYFNTTNNQCQVLPTTQSACTGTDIEWDSANSKCLNKNADTNQTDEYNEDLEYSDTCPEGKIAKGDECIDASQGCGENYRLSDGICYRVRYTPAEAAEVAGETNTIFLYYK